MLFALAFKQAPPYNRAMPELPEVEIVRRGLAPHIEGQRIMRVKTLRPNLRYPFPRGFASALRGARIVRLGRRAKYLLAQLEGGKADYWLAHLGMSGRFLWQPKKEEKKEEKMMPPEKIAHIHVHIEFAHGTLYYADPRRFGFMDIIKGDAAAHPRLRHLGREPLDTSLDAHHDEKGVDAHHYDGGVDPRHDEKGVDARHLQAAGQGRAAPIKAFLLDQSIIAGLGNIYVCEALFAARIDPRRPTHTLTIAQWRRLARAIPRVLQAALTAGGSSLKDFADINGQSGYFQHRFKVYGRAQAPCLRRHCTGQIKSVKQSGRSSFYCALCQD